MAKGISLHIGVDHLDSAKYTLKWYSPSDSVVVNVDEGDPEKPGDPNNLRKVDIPADRYFQVGYFGKLASCEMDAQDMYDIAKGLGFNARPPLKTKDATADRVIEEIANAAKALDPGDIFLLTFAGHGSQVDDMRGEEEDGVDETWCLYDRMLIDDERHDLMAEFAEGVRVVAIVDCCHSGTTMRSAPSESAGRYTSPGAPERVRQVPRGAAKAIYYGRKDEYDKIQNRLPDPPKEIKAKIILISACQDTELAGDGEKNGAFTGALKEVLEEADFKNYRDFHAKILNNLERKRKEKVEEVKRDGGDPKKVGKQTPNFLPEPEEADEDPAMAEFVAQKPLSI